MKKKYLLFIILTIVSGLVGGAISNYLFMARPAIAQEGDLFPGSEPYIPTKLEWLILDLQATYGVTFGDDLDLAITFMKSHRDDPNTVVVYCQYAPRSDRVTVNETIEQRKSLVRSTAKIYGWDWVKVKEITEMIETSGESE